LHDDNGWELFADKWDIIGMDDKIFMNLSSLSPEALSGKNLAMDH